MAARHTRRAALVRLGLGSAGVLIGPRLAHAGRAPQPARDVDDLTARIRAASREGVYDVAADAIAAGASPETLLGASFVAGVQDIRPHGVGGKFHAVLMVESAYQLAAHCSDADRYRVALWSLWDFKRCQQRDVDEEDDWVLPPRPTPAKLDAARARRRLVAAMDAWDVAAADAAVVAAVAASAGNLGPIFEAIRTHGMRCYDDFGHKIIYAAHAERTLARLDARYTEPVLRSLVRGLLYTNGDAPLTASFDSARERVEGFPTGRLDGTDDPEQSLAVLRALRGKTSAGAQDAIVAALAEGYGIGSIWDGLRLRAIEVFHCRGAAAERRHLPVHTVTELNAFAWAWRASTDPTTRRLVLLQVAGWLPLLEADFERASGERRDRPIDRLHVETQTRPSLDRVFAVPDEAGALLAIEAEDDGVERYLATARRHLLERAVQDHQYKFLAALHEECAALHPRWRARFLAPSISYLPTGRDSRTEMRERSDSALKRAGVRA